MTEILTDDAIEFLTLGARGEVLVSFTYGDVSPMHVHTFELAETVHAVLLGIETPFDGEAPSLSVGLAGSPGALLPGDQNLPGEAGVYESSPMLRCTAGSEILLFITPGSGASHGAGTLKLVY